MTGLGNTLVERRPILKAATTTCSVAAIGAPLRGTAGYRLGATAIRGFAATLWGSGLPCFRELFAVFANDGV